MLPVSFIRLIYRILDICCASETFISYAFEIDPMFILGGRQEVGTFKRIDRRFDLLAKEIWKTAGRTFANQDQPPDGLRPSASDGEKVPESDVPGLHPV